MQLPRANLLGYILLASERFDECSLLRIECRYACCICKAKQVEMGDTFSLLTFKVWSDIFPLLAGIFVVIANSRKNEKQLRQFSLLWSVSWLLNSILKMYPVAFINDLFCTVSTVVALARCREKKKDESREIEKSETENPKTDNSESENNEQQSC